MKKILVYPSTTEIGKEIIRSFKYSTHFEIVTASNELPCDFLLLQDLSHLGLLRKELQALVAKEKIDAIYPAHDEATYQLRNSALGNLIITSPRKATDICRYKSKTYTICKGQIKVPEELFLPPFFAKPDKGQGSRGACYVEDVWSLSKLDTKGMIFHQYLPGKEYTIDCYSDINGLLFFGARKRASTSGGISTLTYEVKDQYKFQAIAERIQKILKMRYAWFFQMKEDSKGVPHLLEVAARPSGCSGYWRMQGVNLPVLSAFEFFGNPVEINHQSRLIKNMTRTSTPTYTLNHEFNKVYVDYDDTLIIYKKEGKNLREEVNNKLISLLFHWQNEGKELYLLTRRTDPDLTRFPKLFITTYVVAREQKKSKFIKDNKSIFIDDSFSERVEVTKVHKIPVFSPGEIEEVFSC